MSLYPYKELYMKKHVLFVISLLALEVSGVLAQMNPSPAVPPSSDKTDTMMQMMTQCTNMMSMMSMMQGEGMGSSGMSSGDSMMGQGEMGDQASSEMMEQADSPITTKRLPRPSLEPF
jgi:hypothetical protein